MNRARELGVVEVGLFDSLSVRLNGALVDIGGPKQRLVLAMLCLSDKGISVERLSAALWAHQPPTTARKNIQIYVSKLRRIFGERLSYSTRGYTLALTAEECDFVRFEQFIQSGRDALARGELRAGAELLERGIGCWRDGPLLELAHEPGLADELDHSTERFLGALEDWAELSVERGDYRKVLSTLAAFAPRHLLRERLASGWLRALSDGGRSGEALAHYDRVRRALRAELGVDPGPRLADIHRGLLRGEEIGAGATDSPAVHHIPPDPPDFVARTEEIRTAVRQLAAERDRDVVLITGPAGSGKTALAVSVAHRLGPSFPDGRIMVDLTTTDGVSKTIDAVLDELLTLAGFDHDQARNRRRSLALWRSWVAQRRILLVLDGASDENLARQLLPTGGPSRTVVTGQRRLSGLESVRRLEIGALAEPDSAALLARITGRRAVRDDPAVREVLDYCAGSPLAIRVVGARPASSRRHLRSTLFADENRLRSRCARLLRDLTDVERLACRQIARLPAPPFDHAELVREVRAAVGRPAAVLESLRESYVLWVPQEDSTVYQMSTFFYHFLRADYADTDR